MAVNITSYVNAAYNSAITNENVPDIGQLINALMNILRGEIESCGLPRGVANAVSNSITAQVIGTTDAIVSISCKRPSIYADLGLYGEADIAVIYNYGANIKENAVYYTDDIFIPIGRIAGFAHHPAGGFAQSAVSKFNSRYSDVAEAHLM